MNYHSMVERNREAGRQMAEMAVQVIRDMVQRGEKVKVTELVRRTGFPGHFLQEWICPERGGKSKGSPADRPIQESLAPGRNRCEQWLGV